MVGSSRLIPAGGGTPIRTASCGATWAGGTARSELDPDFSLGLLLSFVSSRTFPGHVGSGPYSNLAANNLFLRPLQDVNGPARHAPGSGMVGCIFYIRPAGHTEDAKKHHLLALMPRCIPIAGLAFLVC